MLILFYPSWLFNPIMNLPFNFKVKRSTVLCVWERTHACKWRHECFCALSPTLRKCCCALPAFSVWIFSRGSCKNPDLLRRCPQVISEILYAAFSSEFSLNQNIHNSIDPPVKAVSKIEEACNLPSAVTDLMSLHTLSFPKEKNLMKDDLNETMTKVFKSGIPFLIKDSKPRSISQADRIISY